MEKFLKDVQEAQAYANMAGGLALAKTICRRKLLEADHTTGQQHLILSIIAEIDNLINHAGFEIEQLSKQD